MTTGYIMVQYIYIIYTVKPTYILYIIIIIILLLLLVLRGSTHNGYTHTYVFRIEVRSDSIILKQSRMIKEIKLFILFV